MLAFACINAFAQNDPNAKKLLDEVSNKVKTFKTVQANYTLSIVSRAGKNVGTKAGVISWKGQKYAMTDKGMQLYCDGQKIWKYEPAANEVSVSAVDNNAQTFTPQKLFTNFYDKDFAYKLNGKKTIGGKSLSEIELTPTNKNKSITKIFVYIDDVQKMIVAGILCLRSIKASILGWRRLTNNLATIFL